ncbi:outer membrane beta-barrel protein [Rariglobus hedericola]|nr:outer membrane beta-barrel protein [Rariglobus hedericola]
MAVAIGGVSLQLSSAHALIKFNEGRDQLFVIGTMAIGYDSNIFANSSAESDVVTNTTLALEYARRAGLISVNGNIGWNLGSFASNGSEDFSNPTMGLELVKNTGRTTGSFTLGASRQSQADANVGLRTDSWNYDAGLNWKYPVIERYSLAGSFGYSLLDYIDNSANLVDLTSYTASTDLFYTYTSQRDLFAGYRIRFGETSTQNTITDHAFTVGVSGKILSKLNGTVRAGYQIRQESASGDTFGSYTASASTTWSVNKRLSLTGTLSKDFSTTATESTMDTTRFNLDAQYAFNHRWSVFTGVGAGYSEFLNGVDGGREDYYITWSAGVNYTLNDHFKASLTYSYFQNWSNRSLSTFDRNSLTLFLSSRW